MAIYNPAPLKAIQDFKESPLSLIGPSEPGKLPSFDILTLRTYFRITPDKIFDACSIHVNARTVEMVWR